MIQLIQYNNKTYDSQSGLTPAEAIRSVKNKMISWVDIESTNREMIEETAKSFNLHPLIVEDILDLDQIPKFEAFEDYIFFSAKMLRIDKGSDTILQEQISIILGENLLITFQEGLPGDVFDKIRQRISLSKSLIRKNGVDYLFYHVLNAIIGNYVEIAEWLRTYIEELEDKTIHDPSFNVMEEVMDIKKKVNRIRRYTLPLWDSLNAMRAEGSHFITKANKNYFHDVNDHVKFILSFCNTGREMLRDIMDLHQSNLNNETNKVMKTLTVVSAIFIPMTFVAGVYGMNFDIMPELHLKYGYPLAGAIMGITALTMFLILKHKKWL